MKTTQNLKMKIPEGGDPIDITDSTGNFETLDMEMAKKANASGGDVSVMAVKTLDAITTSFPIPSAGESVKTFFGKVKKNMEDSNKLINQINRVTEVKLTAAGWSSSAPYTQTVEIPGVTADDRPIVSLYLADGITAAEAKLQSKAYGCVDRAITGSGNITVYCYNKKPAADFQIQIKGV